MKNINDKISVAYYTSTNFLDIAIETIQCIKNEVNLHLFIEITKHSQHSTIVNVSCLDHLEFIEKPEKIFTHDQLNILKKYFDGLSSIQFVVYKNKRTFSINTMLSGLRLSKYFKLLKLDVIHFDTISLRAFGLYPYLLRKRIVITLHDAKPHSGENSWKEWLLTILYYRLAKHYIFYSDYSMNEFKKQHINKSIVTKSISLQPYSYYKSIQTLITSKEHYILFFGRLSYYKGIDILIEAIPHVLSKFPNFSFYIIGKKTADFEINIEILTKYKKSIQIIKQYIPSDQLVQYIKDSDFIVCPYRDASQSGVLMTAVALGKMTIASNVGAFKEYISDNFDGLLCQPNPLSLSEKIIDALHDNKYKELEKNINSNYSHKKAAINSSKILESYFSN